MIAPAAVAAPPPRTGPRRAVAHLRSPQSGQGYALLASSAVTSVLGFAYWAVAARLTSPESLGRGAGLVSAMLLVSTLATAGLKRGVIRFLPTTGAGGPGLVRRVYGTGVALGLGFGLLLLLGSAGWSERPEALSSPWVGVAFLASVAAWCVFVLQDAVLIGVRRAAVVPTANAAFSVAKIVLLVLGAWLVADEWALFGSWVVPAAVTALVVNLWLRRSGRLSSATVVAGATPPTTRQLVRFAGADYVAALLWQSANLVTPLLVLGALGAEANGRFYIAMQIGYALFLVSSNLADAMVAQGASAPRELTATVRRTVTQLTAILVPAVVVTLVAAPWIMQIFGDGYRGDAATVLRVLAIASLPNAITTVAVGWNHVRRRMWAVVLTQSTMAATTIGFVLVALDRGGIESVAVAWLAAQGATCLLALAITIGAERRGSGSREVLLHSF